MTDPLAIEETMVNECSTQELVLALIARLANPHHDRIIADKQKIDLFLFLQDNMPRTPED